MGVQRRGHAERDEVALGHAGEVVGGLEHAGGDELRQVLLHHVADVVLTGVDHLHLGGLHVEADGAEARLGLLHGQGQAHIAEAHSAAGDGAVLNVVENVSVHRRSFVRGSHGVALGRNYPHSI